MNMRAISAIALDLGTTSIKAGISDEAGTILDARTTSAPLMDVSQGGYESNALAYATAVRKLADVYAARAPGAPLGLSCQRSSFLIWEKRSGNPITPLISWQDTRGAACCNALKNSGPLVTRLTGLRLAPYYFAPKLNAVLSGNPVFRTKLLDGEFLAGTLDTYLIWRWTGKAHHVTDASMAARTLLMDLQTQQWSQTLCDLFEIPREILPRIVHSEDLHFELENGLTLHASVADQSAALIAATRAASNAALVNLGTGGFIVRALPEEAPPPDGYLRTLVFQDENGCAYFAKEGTLNSIAAALAPYPVADCRIENLARHDIFCLAEPGGLGAPYFRNDLGLMFSQPVERLTPREIASLLLEAIIFRVARALENFHGDAPVERVYLTGGLSELEGLRQGIAQCMPFEFYKFQQKDASLSGAALLAARLTHTDVRDAERIIARPNAALVEKYHAWKAWLDELLN